MLTAVVLCIPRAGFSRRTITCWLSCFYEYRFALGNAFGRASEPFWQEEMNNSVKKTLPHRRLARVVLDEAAATQLRKADDNGQKYARLTNATDSTGHGRRDGQSLRRAQANRRRRPQR